MIKNPTDAEMAQLIELYKRWENVELASGRELEARHDVVPLTPVEEVHAWEDYALRNFS